MVDVYKRAIGLIRAGRAMDAKPIGRLEAWISRDTEVRDCEGNRLRHPRVEHRLKIEVVRDGQVVAFGEVPIDELVGSL